jgi:hypothetical protein
MDAVSVKAWEHLGSQLTHCWLSSLAAVGSVDARGPAPTGHAQAALCLVELAGLEPANSWVRYGREPLRPVAPHRNKAKDGLIDGGTVAAGFARRLTAC